MAPQNHASKRTASEWVTWANGEGFIDIVEHAPNADTQPGLHAMLHCVAHMFFPIGKVYCSLCATSIAASCSALNPRADICRCLPTTKHRGVCVRCATAQAAELCLRNQIDVPAHSQWDCYDPPGNVDAGHIRVLRAVRERRHRSTILQE